MIPYTTPAANIIQKKVQIIRLKDEIKFQHVKKEKPNNKLYRLHQKAAQEWGNKWYTILDFIKEVIRKKYVTIEMILQTILRTQIK